MKSNILRFAQFIKESSDVNESGIPLFRGAVFTPERTIKRNRLLQELQDLLGQVMDGSIEEVTVLAEVPTQGKNTPQYLKDIYAEMGVEKSGDTEDEDSMYDPETEVYTGDRDKHPDDPSMNIFVDSEFVVKEIDMAKGIIIATPYSLKRKNVLVEIDPDTVDEIFIR